MDPIWEPTWGQNLDQNRIRFWIQLGVSIWIQIGSGLGSTARPPLLGVVKKHRELQFNFQTLCSRRVTDRSGLRPNLGSEFWSNLDPILNPTWGRNFDQIWIRFGTQLGVRILIKIGSDLGSNLGSEFWSKLDPVWDPAWGKNFDPNRIPNLIRFGSKFWP